MENFPKGSITEWPMVTPSLGLSGKWVLLTDFNLKKKKKLTDLQPTHDFALNLVMIAASSNSHTFIVLITEVVE